jgi:hypothetical protein
VLNTFARRPGLNSTQPITIVIAVIVLLLSDSSSFATTKGLSQIVTPDLQPEGDLSLSFQIQDKRIANPYQLQAELGLTKWAEVAVFRGFQPDEWIFGTEIGLFTKEPFLLSAGFVNWSPHLDVDPQPFIEAGYYTEHHKVIVGAIHAGYKNEAILGYAYDFNERWRLQFDWQSGSENSSTIGFTCNVTPISSSIRRCTSATIQSTICLVTSCSLTRFIFGAAKKTSRLSRRARAV